MANNRILLVEDDQNFGDVLRSYLEMHEYEVTLATDGVQGLESYNKGKYDLCIFDKNVNLARLVGANRQYILNIIPHISNLMVDNVDDVLSHAETLVIGNKDNEFIDIIDKVQDNKYVVDLVRINEPENRSDKYDGICW